MSGLPARIGHIAKRTSFKSSKNIPIFSKPKDLIANYVEDIGNDKKFIFYTYR